jgi:hypothetical protein
MEDKADSALAGIEQSGITLDQSRLTTFETAEYDFAEQGSTFTARGNVFTNRSAGFPTVGVTFSRGARFSSRTYSTPSSN